MQYRASGFSNMPPVIKNIIILNVLVWIAQIMFTYKGLSLEIYGGLFPVQTEYFRIWQPITHMFMHQAVGPNGQVAFGHIFFNMLILWMVGTRLENLWGSKRFLQFYMMCGLGAAAAHLLTTYGLAIGASGAVMGVMAGFVYLFPNTEFYIFFGTFPLKAKYILPLLMAGDLFSGISGKPDGIAHWAHLGGAVTGFIIVMIWNRGRGNRRNFY